jgi:L-aspartate oxidase
MWAHVGIVRTRDGLGRAIEFIGGLDREIAATWSESRLRCDVLELRNLATVARLITESAQQRQESRGLHYNRDYPQLRPDPHDTAIDPR